jgi:peptidoglycan/xylan/chitin deacetylase (PgdA/CDA1 family)
MSDKKSILNNKTFLVALSFLLVVILGAGIFGFEYSSAVSKAEKNISSQNNIIKALESENNALKDKNNEYESKNAANESELSNHKKQVDDLNSKIKQLESEISSIKLTKAKINSSKKAASAVKGNQPTIDMSKLTAPNTGYKVCYLTFDDGPSDNTLKILDILKQANAKASFFVIGTSKLDYVKRIHAEGHTVALHANNHDYSKVYKNEDAYLSDIATLSGKVKNLIGIEPKIIRFPGGSSNKVSIKYNKGVMTRLAKKAQQKGYVYVDWNVDSTDASKNSVPKNQIVNNIRYNSAGKGDICVLMHDTTAKKTTVEALPEIICYLRAQGYRFEGLTTNSPIFHHNLNN